MGNWGIAETASEKEKIKSCYADEIAGKNSCGYIDYELYSNAYDVGMTWFDSVYEMGKSNDLVGFEGIISQMIDYWGQQRGTERVRQEYIDDDSCVSFASISLQCLKSMFALGVEESGNR